MTTDDFYKDFMQGIYAQSGADSNFHESTFTEKVCEFLVDQAVLDDFQYVDYRKSEAGMRVDAWNFNDESGVLRLFVTDFRSSGSVESLSQTDITKSFSRVKKFFERCVEGALYKKLEESTPGYELAREIFVQADSIARVEFILLSNAELSKRVTKLASDTHDAFKYSFEIWDIGRLFRIESSGMAREEIVIDFRQLEKEGLPCLPAFTGSAERESYLIVVPGSAIAGLYDEYGERLLEQNVRTFLQFRGKVNKGIRNTICNEPEMFFAYNNGLSATAEHVTTNNGRSRIHTISNLQIVNGGQTTASIFTAMRQAKADLSNVYVQVKLTVVPPEDVESVVPKISEYANTQNKVSAADFFSNHPFHLRIEEMSRRLWSPSTDGGLRETHWFYERARGQFVNQMSNLSPAKKKEFLALNPRHQMFTKTDLAKFEHTFDMLPHTVSLGAQKNFAEFASKIAGNWETKESHFGELYFKRLIAKAILFRFLDKIVMKQHWYGGYKANIVAYSLAKLVRMVRDIDKFLDLESIWAQQQVSDDLQDQLLLIAEQVNEKIQDTPPGVTNVTEWCKRIKCWNTIASMEVDLHPEVEDALLDREENEEKQKSAQAAQKTDNGIHAQTYVFEKGAAYWKTLMAWNESGRLFSPKEEGVLKVACGLPASIPSEKQSQVLIAAEKRAVLEGFSTS